MGGDINTLRPSRLNRLVRLDHKVTTKYSTREDEDHMPMACIREREERTRDLA